MNRVRRKEKYKTAIYCRLSDEDYAKRKEVSESIENQLGICRSFLAEHGELEETGIYIDDGRTGLNYDRDGYIRMMEDVDMGKVDCIITKSLARLGREHAETIRLFKETFVLKGIRYIAVIDNIDFNGRIESIEIPIKVVMNDHYSMEISKNIRSAFTVKAARGEFIGSFATYGYRKDEKNKNHLVVDPEAAEVVKRIYAEFIAGKSISTIMHGLNDDGILCPTEYKKMGGINYSNNRKLEKTYYWTYSTVKKILLNENENYIGNMVQHRTEKLAYNMKQLVSVPKTEWIRAEGTHEPIISKDDYDFVQRLIKQRWKHMECSPVVWKYAGIVYCGDCGRRLAYSKRKDGRVLRCSTYTRIGKEYCSQHLIYEYELDDLVLRAVQDNILDALENMDLEKAREKEVKLGISEENSRLQLKLEDLERGYKKMLMNLSMEIISEEDFKVFREDYQEKKDFLEKRKIELQNQKNRDTLYLSEYQKWLDNFLKYRNVTEVSREMLTNLIERIDVYDKADDSYINIIFRFKKPS